MTEACRQAELLCGAIALGEATDLERERYRRHLAGCSACLDAFGGEREIERVMQTVAQARESETWQPVLESVRSRKNRRIGFALRFAMPVAAFAILASAGIHLFVASSVRPPVLAPAHSSVARSSVVHVALEHRAPVRIAKPQIQPPAQPQPQTQSPRLVVVHNVITLKAPESRAGALHSTAQNPPTETKTTTTVVAQAPVARPVDADIPIWRRGDPMRGRNVSAKTAPPPTLIAHVETIAIAPSNTVRDVVPYGGDTAINPEPPMIAYQEGAEGTTAFEVNVDEHGTPSKCTITKSSGFLVLDNAVCRAAMKAKFSPRMVNGRAVPGIYRDAFTFRSSVNNEGIQPQQ